MLQVLFKVGNKKVPSQYVAILSAFLVFTILIVKNGGEIGMTLAQEILFCITSLICSLIFCKILGTILRPEALLRFPSIVFKFRGFSSYGLIGNILVLIWFSNHYHISFNLLTDIVAIPSMLCAATLRFGCFLNGCCRGLPTNLPWRVKFPRSSWSVHPVQIYEALLCLCLFLTLLTFQNYHIWTGKLLFVSILGYSSIRFFVEFFREGRRVLFSTLTTAQAGSVAIGLSTFITLIK